MMEDTDDSTVRLGVQDSWPWFSRSILPETTVIRFASSRTEPLPEADVDASVRKRKQLYFPGQQRSFSASSKTSFASPRAASPPALGEGHFSVPSASPDSGIDSAVTRRLSDVSSLGSFSRSTSFTDFLITSEPTPPYYDRYWDLIKARSTMLQTAAAAVRVAYEAAYADQIVLWSEFMLGAVQKGHIPYHPMATLSRMLQLHRQTIEDDVIRFAKFTGMVPGFSDLEEADQAVLLSEKYLVSWLLHHAKFIYRGEFYYFLSGPDNVHNCRYWLEQFIGIDSDFFRFIHLFAASFNDIGLTLNETYLLLAAATFAPDCTEADDKHLLTHLHAFYLDALFYQLGGRLSIAERPHAYLKLEQLMKQFPVINKISVKFVNSLVLRKTRIHRSISFQESLCM